jgi:membrane-associated protein
MDLIHWFVDFFLHLDRHLAEVIQSYGSWTYALLFTIIFMETGFVVTPFLPGDSLLFAAGSFAALGALDVRLLFLLLWAAAVLGDNVNYAVGRYLGPRVFHYERSRFFNPEHLRKTHRFYEKYGVKTIIIARFVPIVRTFAPFVAGVGRMYYPRFLAFDVGGGILWVWSFGLLGYFFGSRPIIKENFGFAIIGVIVISILPIVVEAFRARFRRSTSAP